MDNSTTGHRSSDEEFIQNDVDASKSVIENLAQ